MRDASKLADEASAAAREASLNVDRLRESSAAIGNVVNLISQIARQTTLLALNSTIEAARAGVCRTRLRGRRHRGQGTGSADPERDRRDLKKIDTLQKDAAGSVDAVHRISQAIEAIRPVFENVNGAVAEQNETTSEISDNAATASSSSSRSARAPPKSTSPRQAESHGESVASAGKAVTMFAQKLKSRCAVLLRQSEREGSPQEPANAVPLGHGNPDGARHDRRPAYEISIEGILIGGPDAEKLPLNETLNGMLHDIGACRIRVTEQSKAGPRRSSRRLVRR